MHLILLGALTMTPVAEAQTAFEQRTYRNAAGQTLPYALLRPANYDAKVKYPVVLHLHGAGERGIDNRAQLKYIDKPFLAQEFREKYPCFLVCPQCPAGQRWVEVDWSSLAHTLPKEPSQPLTLALELLTELGKEFSFDPQRQYAVGLSMGGYGVWDALSRHPTRFAGAVAVCGGADETQADQLVQTPVWVYHGAKDNVVRVERSRNIVTALEKAGGKPKYTELPTIGHDAWNSAYSNAEVWAWLFACKRPASPASPPSSAK
jgi:predicted peptidase